MGRVRERAQRPRPHDCRPPTHQPRSRQPPPVPVPIVHAAVNDHLATRANTPDGTPRRTPTPGRRPHARAARRSDRTVASRSRHGGADIAADL